MTISRDRPADPYFFGYGSLVNRRTHDFPDARPARAIGWRRVWRHTTRRQAAFLSVEPAPDQAIDGLVAAVPGGDWAALDLREAAYDRLPLRDVTHDLPVPAEVHIYRTSPAFAAPVAEHPILLSYLDCVLQGFLHVFGPAGADAFIATTDGWETPILNDRARPQYARHVDLSAAERTFIDDRLARLPAPLRTP
ncbi:gamma-glutamylcyclotransferase [Maritimibacter sp. 55A14]|uniref:gamma-glutamylcyclotransferase family protein n=1 Tax=Maritimibacter sp. 55A14 TaxID=2174844 RepID=UPI000D609BC3|nr:gamma-glutamylcyclotransferase family protein [Maritimibacter sp. 55A14]PWE32116.1 gamma-glutamylcyclotransferase [Maritimibacter sp. 55A14]